MEIYVEVNNENRTLEGVKLKVIPRIGETIQHNISDMYLVLDVVYYCGGNGDSDVTVIVTKI